MKIYKISEKYAILFSKQPTIPNLMNEKFKVFIAYRDEYSSKKIFYYNIFSSGSVDSNFFSYNPSVQITKTVDFTDYMSMFDEYYYAVDVMEYLIPYLSGVKSKEEKGDVIFITSKAEEKRDLVFSFYKNVISDMYRLYSSKNNGQKISMRELVKIITFVAETEFNVFILNWIKNFAEDLPITINERRRIATHVDKVVNSIVPARVSLLPENEYIVNLVIKGSIKPHYLYRSFSSEFKNYLRDRIVEELMDLHKTSIVIPHMLFSGCCDDADLYFVMCLNVVFRENVGDSAGVEIEKYNKSHFTDQEYNAFIEKYINSVKESGKPYYIYNGLPRIPNRISRRFIDGSFSVEDYDLDKVLFGYIDDQTKEYDSIYKAFLINISNEAEL